MHEAMLPAPPTNVVIDFNFDLSSKSNIKIEFEGKDYALGETTVDENKLAVRRALDPSAPDGLYTVSYTACWPDNSCHDGVFQFGIDRRLGRDYPDQRGKGEVTINLSNTRFAPETIRVSAGTKITWVNQEDSVHYVNTDSHPGHTYFPEQNSKALKKGDSFTVVFNKIGSYPYHCSAHADVMRGVIIVEE